MKTGTRMDQDTYCMYALAAHALDARLSETKKEIAKYKANNAPIAKDIEDAYRYLDLVEEEKELAEDMQGLAGEMAEAGCPLRVWIRFRAGEKLMRLKVEPDKDRFRVQVLS